MIYVYIITHLVITFRIFRINRIYNSYWTQRSVFKAAVVDRDALARRNTVILTLVIATLKRKLQNFAVR